MGESAWLYGAVAGLVGVEAVDITLETDLIQDLGSSLQLVEPAYLEEQGVTSTPMPWLRATSLKTSQARR